MKHNLFTRFLVTSIVLLAPLAAQATLTVNPSPVVQPGGQATVSYGDPSKAGQTIAVVVKGGLPQVEQVLAITLDAAGNGSKVWTAPTDWTAATFEAPNATTVRVTIQ